MSKKRRSRHTGQTKLGDTRQVLIEKLGKVTVYQRGLSTTSITVKRAEVCAAR